MSGIDWFDYKKQLKKGEQWNVEVYWPFNFASDICVVSLCVSVREAKVYCVYNVDSEFVLCITMVVSLGFYMYSYIMSIPFLVWAMSSVHTWKEWWSGSEFPSPQIFGKALVDIFFFNFWFMSNAGNFILHWNWYLHNEHLPLTTNIVTQQSYNSISVLSFFCTFLGPFFVQ